jgi:hypothetical protein
MFPMALILAAILALALFNLLLPDLQQAINCLIPIIVASLLTSGNAHLLSQLRLSDERL